MLMLNTRKQVHTERDSLFNGGHISPHRDEFLVGREDEVRHGRRNVGKERKIEDHQSDRKEALFLV